MIDVRITPYHLIFGPPGFDESRFGLIREQATPADLTSAATLILIPTAGELLRELLPPRQDGIDHAHVFSQVSALMFHAFTFWNADRPIYRISEPAFRRLMASGGSGDRSFTLPGAAGYVQFPRNVMWSRVDDLTPPEPVDGFFFSAPQSTPTKRIDLLLVLGLRRGRPGVSLIDVSLDDAATLEQWATVKARPAGEDFENMLPGGELQMYHGVTLHAEVLKLVALCFRSLSSTALHEPRLEDGNRIYDIDG